MSSPVPPRRPTSPPSVQHLLGLVAVPLLLLAGCGGDGDDAAPPRETFHVEAVDEVDEICEDPVGDLSGTGGATPSGGEPAGIDLVRASAHLTSEQITVRWGTAGDPAAVPSPWYTMIHGSPGTTTSWGLRVDQGDDGAWRTSLLTNESVDDPRGIVTSQEVTVPLAVAPVVGPDGVEVTVERGSLPPVVTVLWLFGATSGEGAATLFDDCSNLFGDGATPSDTSGAMPSDTTGGAPAGTSPVAEPDD